MITVRVYSPEHIAFSTRALTLPPEWEQIALSRPLDCTKGPRGNQDCDGEEQSSAAVGSRETLVARAFVGAHDRWRRPWKVPSEAEADFSHGSLNSRLCSRSLEAGAMP